MRRRFLCMTAALALVGVAPLKARAASFDTYFCTANALSVCMDFGLVDNGSSNYALTVTYVSSTGSPSGYMTSAGIYDILATPSFTFTNVALNPLTGWRAGHCNDLNGNGASALLACSSTTRGINDALAPGGSLTFTFTSNRAINAADFASTGELGYRSHIQGLGINSCSLKPDSRASGNVVGGAAGADAACNGTTTPEPITLALLGTGLLALGMVDWRRKRRIGDD